VRSPEAGLSGPTPTGAAAIAAQRPLLWLVAAAFFMQTLDSTIVNTAVPRIAADLGVAPLALKTALTSYVLTLAICIPASPWLADRFGTRRVFGLSIVVFTLGSLACGLAQSLPQLVAARVLQGVGGALLMPVGRYVLVRNFDRGDLITAMSFVAIPGLLGPALGPVIGGALSEYAHWRWIFLVNLPMGVLGWWLNRRAMPDLRGARRPFDWPGFVSFAVASAALLATAEFLAERRPGAWILAAAATGTAALAWYVRHGRRTAHPLVDLDLLRIRSFRYALLGSIVARLGIAGLPFLFVLYLQVGRGWAPLAAGLMLVPQALAMIAMKPLVRPVLERYGYRRTLFVNTVVVGLLLAGFALLDDGTGWPAMVALVFAYGLAMSLQFTAMNTLAFVDLPDASAGMGSSMTSTAQYLSMSFGIALASIAMALWLGPAGAAAPAGVYVDAFRGAVLVLAGVTVAAAFVFARLRHDRPCREPVEAPETAV
jgi:EmrB/QacA subfamily drug resistance transporter